MCFVTMLSADSSVSGSNRLTNEGWSLTSIASPSETKNRSNLPRSAMLAIDCITGMLQPEV